MCSTWLTGCTYSLDLDSSLYVVPDDGDLSDTIWITGVGKLIELGETAAL